MSEDKEDEELIICPYCGAFKGFGDCIYCKKKEEKDVSSKS